LEAKGLKKNSKKIEMDELKSKVQRRMIRRPLFYIHLMITEAGKLKKNRRMNQRSINGSSNALGLDTVPLGVQVLQHRMNRQSINGSSDALGFGYSTTRVSSVLAPDEPAVRASVHLADVSIANRNIWSSTLSASDEPTVSKV
jgi:hypothetical protein